MAVRRSNPLALAVLVLLDERPMHPYEMATTLRERSKHDSIKLNYGSLYTVVEALQRDELVTAQETVRDGRRPERTIYAITEAGKVIMVDWLSELVRTPAKEYPQFEAGLSLMSALSPKDALRLLKSRELTLTVEMSRNDAVRDSDLLTSVPRAFWIETDYRWHMMRAEHGYLVALIADIEAGRLEGLAEWTDQHEPKPRKRLRAAN